MFTNTTPKTGCSKGRTLPYKPLTPSPLTYDMVFTGLQLTWQPTVRHVFCGVAEIHSLILLHYSIIWETVWQPITCHLTVARVQLSFFWSKLSFGALHAFVKGLTNEGKSLLTSKEESKRHCGSTWSSTYSGSGGERQFWGWLRTAHLQARGWECYTDPQTTYAWNPFVEFGSGASIPVYFI